MNSLRPRAHDMSRNQLHFSPAICDPSTASFFPIMDALPKIQLDHTFNHIACPACQAENTALQAEKINFSELTLAEARRFWLLRRAQSSSLQSRTHERDTAYLDALDKFFGHLRLREITPGHIRAYQFARQANEISIGGETVKPWKRGAKASTINHEISLLGRILHHCRLWQRIKPYYFPLAVPGWSPRKILSDDDEEVFFARAAADKDCALAYWTAAITTNTSASGCELRGLRLKHIFLRAAGEISEIYIPEDAAKNDCRPRKIALNSIARWAVEQCYRRAHQLGSTEPEHYLFPFRNRDHTHDPERPPSRWLIRNSWTKLRNATGFHEVKPHDFRFLCVTKLFEAGIDPDTVRAIAGHVSPRMTEYYSHHRTRSKYAALTAIEPKKPPASVRTGSPSHLAQGL